MTEQDIYLVAGLSGLAVAITLVDLLLSLVRHRRRVAAAGADGRVPHSSGVSASAAFLRLAAIQGAADEGSSSLDRGSI